jgi:hypothetical protein
MADVLGKIRSDLEKRLRELEPLIEEHAHVRKALDALNGAGTRTERAVKSAVRRPRSTTESTTTATRRRGRPRGTGQHAEQALKLVHAHPGITLQEIAKRMKIKNTTCTACCHSSKRRERSKSATGDTTHQRAEATSLENPRTAA